MLVQFDANQVKALKDFWLRKRYLIIDEVSMIGASFFNYISAAITVGKCGKASSNNHFGGVNVICCGDFFQLPPVNARALYCPPVTGEKPFKANTAEFLNNAGCLVFQEFKTVNLTEQVRQVGDPRFHELLKNLRKGACTQSDYQLLRSRLLKNNLHQASEQLNFFASSAGALSKIIVSENALRSKINDYMVIQHAKFHNVPCFKFYAQDTTKEVRLSENVLSYIKTLPETKTGGLPGILFCARSIPMTLTQNVDKSLRLYDGQVARFLGFIPGQNDRNTYCFNRFQVYKVKQLLKYLILDIPDTPFRLDEQPSGFLPLAPQRSYFSIPFLKTTVRQKSAFTVGRKGFAVVSAFAITWHKSQGVTLESGVIDLVPNKKCTGHQRTPASLSRFRSLANLFVLREFDLSVIQAGIEPALQMFLNKTSELAP